MTQIGGQMMKGPMLEQLRRRCNASGAKVKVTYRRPVIRRRRREIEEAKEGMGKRQRGKGGKGKGCPDTRTFYNCGVAGHIAPQCPKAKVIKQVEQQPGEQPLGTIEPCAL